MAIAAVAHVFVFPAKPYHFVPLSGYGEVASETTKVKIEEGARDEENPDVYERTETKVEAPGTSVKESVQDIVVEGGHHVSHNSLLYSLIFFATKISDYQVLDSWKCVSRSWRMLY